jgi:exodeoxyribonuclease VII large subunit
MVEALDYGDRRVYTVASFNRGVAGWLARLPSVWVEGEVTELRRQQAWQSVFFTLKDPEDGACLPVTMPRGRFDALGLDLRDGERVHVMGRPQLYEARGDFRFRALSVERFGLGAHLARIERLKARLGDEGLFDASRKRPLPRLPRRIGLVTGADAAAKRDVITTLTTRFPPARVLVAEAFVQGPRAPEAIVSAIARLCEEADVDVIVLTRGGGSFEDLLPFSDERVVRAVARCPVPVVSAVGHEQDTPLCDLAADVRASTPTAAAKIVVPELVDVLERLERNREALARRARRTATRHAEGLEAAHVRLRRAPTLGLERHAQRLASAHERLRRAPLLALERRDARLDGTAGRLRALSPRATVARGYAIVRAGGSVVRSAAAVVPGARVEVELAEGGFGARVEEVRP